MPLTMLVAFLERHGHDDDAERIWREAVAAGDREARGDPAELLQRRGQREESVRAARADLEPGYFARPD
jgi:hypothetical protein